MHELDPKSSRNIILLPQSMTGSHAQEYFDSFIPEEIYEFIIAERTNSSISSTPDSTEETSEENADTVLHKLEFPDRNLMIDFDRNEVVFDEKIAGITQIQFKLLSYLALNADVVKNRSEILTDVWLERSNDVNEHVINVHVCEIRKATARDIIRTKRGAGFIFDSINSQTQS